MDDEDQGAIHSTSEGGVAGKHAPADQFQFLVGPSTDDQFNTARLRLIPIACWRVDDIRFDFDSSFVLPDIQEEMQILADLITDHTKEDLQKKSKQPPPISIFGHADPVGQDDYNKYLSGRRAAAIYGMLTRRDEIWEDIFSNLGVFTHPLPGDKWGTRAIQIMLGQLGFPMSVSGETDAETRNGVQQFQTKNGLGADGNPGPATRKKLFLAYMDAVCTKDNGDLFRVDKQTGFLARNDDPDGKGDFQGCGEFNPVLIFSEQDNATFEQSKDKTDRNAANAPNRRVMALLFQPGSVVVPTKWPCPRAKEGVAGCIKRFWSDGEKRRNTRLSDQPREFDKTHDTFACRFYQRISDESPCARILPLTFSHISVLLRSNSGALPLADLPYRITVDPQLDLKGKTDKDGLIEHPRVPPGDYPLELNGVLIDTLVHTQPLHIERCPLRIPDFPLFDESEEQLPDASETDDVVVSDVDPRELEGLEPA